MCSRSFPSSKRYRPYLQSHAWVVGNFDFRSSFDIHYSLFEFQILAPAASVVVLNAGAVENTILYPDAARGM